MWSMAVFTCISWDLAIAAAYVILASASVRNERASLFK